jgi:hypothetical protein
MVKEYIRKCDCCKKEIKNLYDFGVTTIYSRVRIGRGSRFKDYDEKTIYNDMKEKTPDDYDSYGVGYSHDENREFNFCSPECLIKLFEKLYLDTYKESLKQIKEKQETLGISILEFKKKYGEKIPFFQKIQTNFSKKMFEEQAKKEFKDLLNITEDIRKKIFGDNQLKEGKKE